MASYMEARDKNYCVYESNKRKTFVGNALVPLGKLPHINDNDMERDADLLGQ